MSKINFYSGESTTTLGSLTYEERSDLPQESHNSRNERWDRALQLTLRAIFIIAGIVLVLFVIILAWVRLRWVF